jgi:hypothetical protein
LEHGQAIGEKLLAAKKLAGHGRWESWAEANLPFSIDKAERLMRLHKNWDRVKSAPEPILGIKAAIAYLTAENKRPKQGSPGSGQDDTEKDTDRKPTADRAGDGAVAARRAGASAKANSAQPTCPNCGCTEFDADGDCARCHEPHVGPQLKTKPEPEDVVDGEVEIVVEDEDELPSIRDFYVDPGEADFFCPEEPLDEDTLVRLEVQLESMERPLSLMLEHEAVAALSDHDPLKVGLTRLERALMEVSAALERKRPTCLDALQVE